MVKNVRAQNLLDEQAKALAIDGAHILKLFRDIEEPSLRGVNLSLSNTGSDPSPDGKTTSWREPNCQVELIVAPDFPDPSS